MISSVEPRWGTVPQGSGGENEFRLEGHLEEKEGRRRASDDISASDKEK
jgi:hypothetical protein